MLLCKSSTEIFDCVNPATFRRDGGNLVVAFATLDGAFLIAMSSNPNQITSILLNTDSVTA
jgi:hypothetical protein